MTNKERAKQFLPFNALRGYYDLIRKEEKIIEIRKELSEEDLQILENKFSQLKKGTMVKVKYYRVDGYIEIEGMLTKIDEVNKSLSIVKEKIKFADIIDLKCDYLVELE